MQQFKNINLYGDYQPIISITKGKIVGFEGLARGRYNDKIISPKQLFETARKTKSTIELDRLCREIILNNFVFNKQKNKDPYYLFVNIDSSIIEKVEGSNFLYKQALYAKINPRNIVIEITESETKDIDKLLNFVSIYKKRGFLIALDDVGTGFSNIDRISLLKPDIIKLDRSLISDIDKNRHKQEILKSFVKLANIIGTIVIAEGIETELEAYNSLEFGAHLLQGYYFSIPKKMYQHDFEIINNKIDHISVGFKQYMKNKIIKENLIKTEFENAMIPLRDRLKNYMIDQFNEILDQYIKSEKIKNIECVYILDIFGKQVSDTILRKHPYTSRKKLFFSPAQMGTDHSFKEYYRYLMNSASGKYYSRPYISTATGNVCCTISMMFISNTSQKYVLCVDYKYNNNYYKYPRVL